MAPAIPNDSDFSIILVNYKSLELTQACLTLLRERLQGASVPVYVVDNDSNDASVEYLRTLDWIELIERRPEGVEVGSAAHGRALDLALEQVKTEYVFLLHTDTFIYDADVFSMMLDLCKGPGRVAAVGCLEQLNRGVLRTLWRLTSRFTKHYFRHAMIALGIPGRLPKAYKEHYLKSFCALWNVRAMKLHGLKFLMDDRNPGYALQDRMRALGYATKAIPPRQLFRYLAHFQSGTVSALGGYGAEHRRVETYQQQMGIYQRSASKAPVASQS